MSTGLRLSECVPHGGDFVTQIVVAVENTGTVVLGPGGVRFVVDDGAGHQLKVSAPFLWPLAPGEVATVVGGVPAMRPGRAPRRIIDFAWVEASGAVHPIDGVVTISFTSGARIEHRG